MNEDNKIIEVSLDNLVYDIDNPRIPKSIKQEDFQSVLEWMINKENVIDLMYSIGEKGFFPGEPLLVVQCTESGKYITVEGNRRYTAAYLLQNPDKAPVRKSTIVEIVSTAKYRPEKLPVIVFKSREDILDYLGYRHITGVEPWDALSKARYLKILYDRLGDDMTPIEKYRALARQIGSRTSYVRQILVGGLLVEEIEREDYFKIRDLNDQTFEFGSFYTAIVKPNIGTYIGIDLDADDALKDINKEHLCDLVTWMFEKNGENQTRIGESRNLTRLNKILDPKYSKALEAFKSGVSLSSAVDLTDEADEIVSRKINESLNAIKIAWSYFPQIKEYSTISKDYVREINKTAVAFYKALEAKLESEQGLEDIN